jgi:hypothetical protein
MIWLEAKTVALKAWQGDNVFYRDLAPASVVIACAVPTTTTCARQKALPNCCPKQT